MSDPSLLRIIRNLVDDHHGIMNPLHRGFMLDRTAITLLPPESYQRELDVADRHYADGEIAQAQQLYGAIAHGIQSVYAQESQSYSLWMATMVGVLGGCIPVLRPVMASVGAFFGYRLARVVTNTKLVDSPYWAVYRRGVEGFLRCMGPRA